MIAGGRKDVAHPPVSLTFENLDAKHTVGDLVEVRNPASSGSIVGTYPKLNVSHVDSLVNTALTAQSSWGILSANDRYQVLRQAAAVVDVTGLDSLLVREQGKILSEASLEMGYLAPALDRLSEHIEWLDEGISLPDNGRHATKVFKEPMGVVGILTPWNWPYALALVATLPALLAGNAVVLHLSPTAPLAALSALNQFSSVLPLGVLSVITAPGITVARHLVGHEQVRKIAFTGSTATGRTVAQESQINLKSTLLELGGNDPAVLLDDAPYDDQMFEQLSNATFTTSGQVCMAIKRLYVPMSRVDTVLDGLASKIEDTVVGNGLDPATTMGPLHTKQQRERFQYLLELARRVGGTVHEYGHIAGDERDGWFVRPSLVVGVDNRAELVQEEQFGPSLPLIPYRDTDHAIDLANESEFGLCSSVWSQDHDHARSIARRLQAGTTWINDHGIQAQDARAPFGGFKQSGNGRGGGGSRWAIDEFTETHAIVSRSNTAEA